MPHRERPDEVLQWVVDFVASAQPRLDWVGEGGTGALASDGRRPKLE